MAEPEQPASPALSGSLRPAASGPSREPASVPFTLEPLHPAQKDTQPLIAMPDVVQQNAPVEKRSLLLYWMLLSISALILIIQIWTYFS